MSFSSSALADLLLALQSLVQRLRTQPPEHPSVATAALGLERALLPLLRARERLVIEVRSVQLTVDGMETNPDYEPLRDLAIHCRGAGVGAIEFRAGVTAAELVPVLGTLAVGAPLSATPHCLLRPLLPRRGSIPGWSWSGSCSTIRNAPPPPGTPPSWVSRSNSTRRAPGGTPSSSRR